VLTIVHEKAGRAQLDNHRVIGPSGDGKAKALVSPAATNECRMPWLFDDPMTRWPDRFADVF
jgi:hypothetical protein